MILSMPFWVSSIISATPGHFWKARQELAALKQLAGFSKNALTRPGHHSAWAETVITALGMNFLTAKGESCHG
jgi:hypothetical protein